MFKYADYIYKIYEEQSFTQAANKLFISQPSLSATIKKAENELGFKIFARGTSPLSLTDAGKVYISAIEEMYAVKRNLINCVENIYSLNAGDISVGGAAFISSFILPKIIMEFSKRHPKINILFVESNSQNLQEKLTSEEIEILIDYDFDSEIFESYPIKDEQILLAIPKDRVAHNIKGKLFTAKDIALGRHLNSKAQSIDLSVFRDEKFIQLKPGNSMYKKSCKICMDFGFVPSPAICVDQLLTAYNIASSGMGMTFTTDTVVCSAADSGNLLFCKVDSSHAQRTLYIAYKRKKYISPAVTEFIKIAREIYS